MSGFINSPALAKVVALQMLEEQRREQRRGRKTRTFRARLAVRRTRATAPAPRQVLRPSGTLAEDV